MTKLLTPVVALADPEEDLLLGAYLLAVKALRTQYRRQRQLAAEITALRDEMSRLDGAVTAGEEAAKRLLAEYLHGVGKAQGFEDGSSIRNEEEGRGCD